MKKVLLTLVLFSFLTISAQTTFDIDWVVGAAPADLTIDQGDSVRWTWGDGLPHSVTSLPGSAETFDSGIITGAGTEFLYTFTMVGTNPYQCDVHPGNMNGTITVEQVLSVEDKFAANVSIYPNPVQDDLTIFSLFKLDSYSVHSVTGQLVMQGETSGNFTTLNVSTLQPGIYFVNVNSGDLSHTAKIIVSK